MKEFEEGKILQPSEKCEVVVDVVVDVEIVVGDVATVVDDVEMAGGAGGIRLFVVVVVVVGEKKVF